MHTTVEYINGVDSQGNPTYSSQTIHGRDNIASARNATMTNQSNFALAQYQNLWNRQQLEDERAYNSPTAQRDRLLQAGYNPAFYDLEGNGNSAHLESADMANQQQANLTPPSQTWNNLTSGINQAAQSILAPLQLAVEKKKADATIDNLNSSSAVNREKVNEVRSIVGVNNEKAKELMSQQDYLQAQTKLAYQHVKESIQNVGESKTRSYLYRIEAEFKKETLAPTVENLCSSTGLNRQNTELAIQKTINAVAEKTLIENNGQAIELKNFAQELENQFKAVNMSQEFDKNRAEIVQKSYGMFAPLFTGLENFYNSLHHPEKGPVEDQTKKPDYTNPSLMSK